MTKATKVLDDLFHDTLKDIYFAEKKIIAALPKMAKAAESPELKEVFEMHRVESGKGFAQKARDYAERARARSA